MISRFQLRDNDVSICSPNKDMAGAIRVCPWEIGSTRHLRNPYYLDLGQIGDTCISMPLFKVCQEEPISHTQNNGSCLILLSPLQMETVPKILIKMRPLSTDGAILISVLKWVTF